MPATAEPDILLSLLPPGRMEFTPAEPLSEDEFFDLCQRADPLRLERDANGTRLSWLIDPQTETVTIYRKDGSTETLNRPESVEATAGVDGSTLPMARIWDPLGDPNS